MTGKIQKVREKGIRHYMKWSVFKATLKKFSPRYQKLLIFEQPIAQARRKANPKIPVQFRIARNIDEISTLIDQREKWYSKLAVKRFSEGNLCYVAERDSKTVSCVWTSFNSVYLPNIEYNLEVESNVVPLVDGWTSPEFRGMGIYNFVWNECLDHLVEQLGYDTIYGFIQPSNSTSLAVHRKIKLLNVIKLVTLIKIFGLRFHRVKEFDKKPISEII